MGVGACGVWTNNYSVRAKRSRVGEKDLSKVAKEELILGGMDQRERAAGNPSE